MIKFRPFDKIPRLSREVIVTEKIDGTNASIYIVDADALPIETPLDEEMILSMAVGRMNNVLMFAGSRTRWITPKDDNFGFAKWAQEHAEELFKLGPGHHFGEWYGPGIQRGYGLDARRFALFNVTRWADPAVRPACCDIVPVLLQGDFDTPRILNQLERLRYKGSVAAPGFMPAEGIVVFHTAANQMFKKTLTDDSSPKSLVGLGSV